ncbi:hypothetical protein GQ55_5G209600 [Panicum hallii var. hallii]|uniref:Uncharacterized protein n=1 Tax=Panicum hallii var. hallii TaxID=1504633 RepID=A0A2T7DIM5_9POAL|nr:hypothetical protein GQ55_5G209600 [Panicum hallii var. hallii]PUZ55407.1 hypothetical protein GQ55_5G209600 [Panicum hallii var. hallii]
MPQIGGSGAAARQEPRLETPKPRPARVQGRGQHGRGRVAWQWQRAWTCGWGRRPWSRRAWRNKLTGGGKHRSTMARIELGFGRSVSRRSSGRIRTGSGGAHINK